MDDTSPIAFWAACKTVLASCAEAMPAHTKNNTLAKHNRFAIAPPIFLSEGPSNYGFARDHTPTRPRRGSAENRTAHHSIIVIEAVRFSDGRLAHATQRWDLAALFRWVVATPRSERQ